MKYIVQIIIFSSLVLACQIEDEDTPAPDDSFIKYYGELASYKASDIDIIYDDSGEILEGFIIFGTKTSPRGDDDYFILRTAPDGTLMDSTSFGVSDVLDLDDDGVADDWTGDGNPDRFNTHETAGQILPINGVGYGFIGSSSVNISALSISDWKGLSFGFLNESLQLINDTLFFDLSRNSNGDFLDIIGNDMILLANGEEILLVGGQEYGSGSAIEFDFFYRKINYAGEDILHYRRGLTGMDEDDILVRAFEKPNGNLVMIGNSQTISSNGENMGDNGMNVLYLETDSHGTPINSASYGFDDSSNNTVFNEEVNNVIKTSFGYTIVGTSNTSQNQEFAFIMNLSNNGIFLSGNTHNNSVFNTENNVLQTRGRGVVQTVGNNLILIGEYPSFSTSEISSRSGEGMFVKFDQAANPIVGTETFFGLSDGNDVLVDAVVLPDGKIVAVGNINFGGGVTLISLIKLNDDGTLE